MLQPVQMSLFNEKIYKRPKAQLMKWIGNKFRFAEEITKYFPENHSQYIEPFVGTGAVLGTLSPKEAIAGDALKPLVEIWWLVQKDPQKLIDSYRTEITRFNENRDDVYYEIRERFNQGHNPEDLMFLSRTCYGGVVRFRKSDGFMSTPVGPHKPVPPDKFEGIVHEWRERVKNTQFFLQDYKESFSMAKKGSVIYCDPPYVATQKILYGAQSFHLKELYQEIQNAKDNGCYVALSIDGAKKSNKNLINIDIPDNLFERELLVECGSSMLRRFQKNGMDMTGEGVKDRLLLTW